MTEELPISIKACDELQDIFPSLNSVTNKLEAQLNFQTLAAGWYGDEESILLISLYLQSPEDFAFQQRQNNGGELTYFADDVFSYHDQQEQQLSCYIAITETELKLLRQQQKLLAGYLQKKVLKVINLIANKLSLLAI
ncbi:MAG: hypothetical protein MJK12_01370 [Colwellia sp.]|nr:hypothetical protein [Colwellia sp.]